MSSLVGLGLFRNISRCAPLALRQSNIRYISTSKKNRDTASVASEVEDKTVCDVNPKKNWISFGFSIHDYEEDRHFTHVTMFCGVTIVFCLGGFILAYRPDDMGIDWAQREAFLEIRRREKLGLPLIDANYIPESKIKLPSDEELGDTEIVI